MIAKETLVKLAHPTDCRHDCDCIGNIAKELLVTRAELESLRAKDRLKRIQPMVEAGLVDLVGVPGACDHRARLGEPVLTCPHCAVTPACTRCCRRLATAAEKAHPEGCLCVGCAGEACFGTDTVGCAGDP